MPRPRQGSSSEAWCMRPEFHDQVQSLLDEVGLTFRFHEEDESGSQTKYKDSNIMGRFVCRNRRCNSPGWGSKRIAIYIRMYGNRQYNARVYLQRCKTCKHLGDMTLDEECYAERVVYWLKKWNGVHVDKPPFSGNSKLPHKSELCEGCRNGHCSQLDRDF